MVRTNACLLSVTSGVVNGAGSMDCIPNMHRSCLCVGLIDKLLLKLVHRWNIAPVTNFVPQLRYCSCQMVSMAFLPDVQHVQHTMNKRLILNGIQSREVPSHIGCDLEEERWEGQVRRRW